MEKIVEVALRAARAAGRVHRNSFKKLHEIAFKSSSIDLVTDVDREAEDAAVRAIRAAFRDHAILAEESGSKTREDAEFQWIIDPLDGTTNYAHGFPQCCVSIAVRHRRRLEVGVVYDALKKELFVARRGMGTTLNGRKVSVSRLSKLEGALLGTGFAYDRRQRARFYLSFWEAFMMRAQGIRRTGSAALDLAYVACGRYDGFWEFGLNPWDIAAGALLVREAGGRVTNMDGSPLDLAGRNILATNAKLHRSMIRVIAATYPAAKRRQMKSALAADVPDAGDAA